MRRFTRLVFVSVVLLGLSVGTTGPASAAPIGPGFDLFATPADVGASVDLAGFGLGTVALEGVPFLFDADTVIARIDPGPAAGTSDVIDIEIVALHLTSVAPVDLTPLGGPFVGVFSDLHIIIDQSDSFWTGITPFPDRTGLGPSLFGLPFNTLIGPSLGRMNITHPSNVPLDHSGSFTSCFGSVAQCTGLGEPGLGQVGGGIFAEAFFTVVGGDPNSPLDVFFSTPAPAVNLAGSGNWSHIPRGGIAPNGNFKVIDITHTGPHPVVPVPEPGTALLFGAAMLGLLGTARTIRERRRR